MGEKLIYRTPVNNAWQALWSRAAKGVVAMSKGNVVSKYYAVAVAFLVLLQLFAAAPVSAKDGRDFAGFYKVLQETNQVDEVEVKLSLRVFNYSSEDVTEATISLHSSLPNPSFDGVAVNVNERKIVPPLVGTFKVSASDYAAWKKGTRPPFVIEFTDASGKVHQEAIELAHVP
jgi:hypothetical protein